MRNLQKILALVLAMLMSFSLIATAGAADFPDAADITDAYQDAVKVLNGLKVFQGYKEDGTFRPKGNITRAEVAAIIYRIATGDVEDTQNSIYSTYGQFTDVADGSWYSGYVNYCANAGYIKGRGNKIFDPNSTVTGYEALAMILRAVGYDKNGEFTGSNWQIRTASIAREKDITKNVTSGQLGQAASRETVAEILFRSIMIPKVNFNANTLSYTEKGAKETLGYESLKLEEITGIVTANEFADLEDDETLADGRTRLNVNGTNYTLNYTSTLDDIGESRTAYIKNGNVSEVFVLSDSGDNVIYDDGKKIDVDDAAKEKGLKVDSTTEYFVNYDPDVEYEADWRIEYVYRMADTSRAAAIELCNSDTTRTKGTNANGILYRVNADGSKTELTIPATPESAAYQDIGTFEYVKIIKAEEKLSETDKSCIRTIFRQADYTNSGYIDGEVYVGTTSITKVDDISDDISYKEFLDTYITIIENDTFDSNTLGNRLKVIDNDDDGIAEYVLKTIYTVTKVSSVASDGKFTLMTKNLSLGSPDDVNMIDNDTKMVKFNSGDELKAEDVVLYAVIDGKAQTWLAKTESAKIDKIDRVGKKVTTTDSTEYADSSVNVRPKNNGSVVIGLDDDVTRMAGSTTYSLYFDLYGNLAAFNEANEAFVLLADGWYNRVKGGDEYAVRAWMDGKLQTVDVTTNGDLFIYNDDNSGQNNSWGQLRALGGPNVAAVGAPEERMLNADRLNSDGTRDTEEDDIRTTVAMLSSDGVLTPVDMAYRTLKDTVMIAMNGDQLPTRNGAYGQIYSTRTNSADRTAYNTAVTSKDVVGMENVDVRALSSTKYYFVYNAYSGNTVISTVVREYTGYQNLPEESYYIGHIEDVYAVGTKATSATDAPYYTADVVVVELDKGYYNTLGGEQVFIPHFPVVGTNVTREEVDLIRQTGVRETVTIDLSRSDIRYYDEADGLGSRRMTGGLYYMWESSSNSGIYYVKAMLPSEIAASNRYYVGMVDYSTSGNGTGTAPSDYVVLDTYGRNQDGEFFAVGSASARNVTSSSYYTLKYSGWEATLTNSTRQEALTQRPEADRNRADYCTSSVYNEWRDGNVQLNEVLVAYNVVNGVEEITYAISFNEYKDYDGSREGEHLHDNAQTVWFNSMPLVEDPVKGVLDAAREAANSGDLTRMLTALNDLNNLANLDDAQAAEVAAVRTLLAGKAAEAANVLINTEGVTREQLTDALVILNDMAALLSGTDKTTVENAAAAVQTAIDNLNTDNTASVTIADAETAGLTVTPVTVTKLAAVDLTLTATAENTTVPASADKIRISVNGADVPGGAGTWTYANGVITFAANVIDGDILITAAAEPVSGQKYPAAVKVTLDVDEVTSMTGDKVGGVSVFNEKMPVDENGQISLKLSDLWPAGCEFEVDENGVTAEDDANSSCTVTEVPAAGTTEQSWTIQVNPETTAVTVTVVTKQPWIKVTYPTPADPDAPDISGDDNTDVTVTPITERRARAAGDLYRINIYVRPGYRLADVNFYNCTYVRDLAPTGKTRESDGWIEWEAVVRQTNERKISGYAKSESTEGKSYVIVSVTGENIGLANPDGYYEVTDGTASIQVIADKDYKLALNTAPSGAVVKLNEATSRVSGSGSVVWTIPVTVSADGDVKVVLKAVSESQAEEELLPYKAELDAGTYKLYKYGEEGQRLTPDEVRRAIAVAAGVKEDEVVIHTDTGVADITTTGTPYSIKFNVSGDNSMNQTGSLRKVSYNGQVLGYVKDNTAVTNLGGFCNGATGYVILKGVAKGTLDDDTVHITRGVATQIAANFVDGKDAEFVDAVKLTLDKSSIDEYGVRGHTSWNKPTSTSTSTTIYAPIGAYVRVYTKTATAGTTYTLVVDDVEKGSWTAPDTNAGTLDFEVTALPEYALGEAMVKVTTKAAVEPVETYDVYLDDVLVKSGVTEKDEDGKDVYLTEEDGFIPGAVLINASSPSGKTTKYYTTTSAATYVPATGEGISVTSVKPTGGKSLIKLYTGTKVDLDDIGQNTELPMVMPRDRSCKPIGLGTTSAAGGDNVFYVAKGATITLQATAAKKYLSITEKGEDTILGPQTISASASNPATFDYTVTENDVKVSEIETLFNLTLKLKNFADGTQAGSIITLNSMTGLDGTAATVELSEFVNVNGTQPITTGNGLLTKDLASEGRYVLTVKGIKAADGYTLKDLVGSGTVTVTTTVGTVWQPSVLTSAGDETYELVIGIILK